MSAPAGWSDALSAFAVHLEGPRGPRSSATADTYVRHVRWLADFTDSAGPWVTTRAQLQTWLDSQTWSRDTRRKVLVSVRRFYAWGINEGACQWAPTAGLQSSTPRTRGPQRRTMPAAWREPAEEYLAACRARGHSEGTIRQREWWLRRLAEVAGDPWAVTTQQLAVLLSNPDWKPATKRGGRSAFRSFYAWAARGGYVATSPAVDVDPVRIPRSLPRPAPRDVIREAISSADDRTRLMVMLAAYAGLRAAEIAKLHTSEVVGDSHLVVTGKGGHHRIVPLHPELAREYREEMSRRQQGTTGTGWGPSFVTTSGYLFPSDLHPGPITAKHVSGLVSRALSGDWTAHKLRHYFATSAYAVQRDLLTVQQLLGHAKPETTAVYAAVPDGALAAAVAGVTL